MAAFRVIDHIDAPRAAASPECPVVGPAPREFSAGVAFDAAVDPLHYGGGVVAGVFGERMDARGELGPPFERLHQRDRFIEPCDTDHATRQCRNAVHPTACASRAPIARPDAVAFSVLKL